MQSPWSSQPDPNRSQSQHKLSHKNHIEDDLGLLTLIHMCQAIALSMGQGKHTDNPTIENQLNWVPVVANEKDLQKRSHSYHWSLLLQIRQDWCESAVVLF